ncbi:peptidoglycan-binding protein [Streptomyces sp. HB132]|uniref:peptidoglycan-binding protein n=1 Tax=Streptomyces sp. HB132 TaxID=767388 RepID=UPI0019617267|nr:peptidoglycan-binding protein [Streptomyces sp. HB132]MBM7438056.1 transcriptional regulator with XRE-family HTH domain [Streptomyces sp. HB132]
MPRWKELPAQLPPPARQLIVRLRGLKDRSGLSSRQLAARTGYSAKSWQRYLNGRSLPPQEAVAAMSRVGGEDPVRLLALREIAAQHWLEGRPVAAPASESPAADPASEPASAPAQVPGERQPYGRHLRAALTAATVVTVLSVSVALLLAVRLTEARTQLAHQHDDAVATAPATVSETLVPVIYTCRLERRDGRWQAGLSPTADVLLSNTQLGLEVAEAQCLLRRAGTVPGDIDGIFGPKTRRAVEHLQKRNGLIVNGVIDPPTWNALREADPT